MYKKRNVAYIKPQEPEFLSRLKKEAGFTEGPTVDSKKAVLPHFSDDDEHEDRPDESPVVVVLKPGDLTEKEADQLRKKQELEEENRPAQLGDRIIFKPLNKRKPAGDTHLKKKLKTQPTNSKLLSFNNDEVDD